MRVITGRAVVVAAVVLLGAALAGCSKKDNNSADTSAAIDTSAQMAASSTTPVMQDTTASTTATKSSTATKSKSKAATKKSTYWPDGLAGRTAPAVPDPLLAAPWRSFGALRLYDVAEGLQLPSRATLEATCAEQLESPLESSERP